MFAGDLSLNCLFGGWCLLTFDCYWLFNRRICFIKDFVDIVICLLLGLLVICYYGIGFRVLMMFGFGDCLFRGGFECLWFVCLFIWLWCLLKIDFDCL